MILKRKPEKDNLMSRSTTTFEVFQYIHVRKKTAVACCANCLQMLTFKWQTFQAYIQLPLYLALKLNYSMPYKNNWGRIHWLLM